MFRKRTGYETVIVKSDRLARGPETEMPEIDTAIDAGQDDKMFIPAWEDVREEITPEDHEEGTHVATIHYDMDAKSYELEYYVETESEKEEAEAEDEGEADAQ
ncbi:hypothetical protein JCM30237_03390 [Halolamina litorea]|uniref:Uncharacterized protein n=1 Tax=Halolamina litorea TaxID=1515593 RepID=A0ABD6BV81_9EURY|nr:hypothetical protein [Halolamina litorea]